MSVQTETVTVEFSDVGRGKTTWRSTVKRDEDELIRAIRKSGALMSRTIEVTYETEDNGSILVGGFRVVGSWRVLKAENDSESESLRAFRAAHGGRCPSEVFAAPKSDKTIEGSGS